MWSLAILAAVFATVMAQSSSPLYGQCGGTGWTGPETCAQGVCTYSNPYYSQCLPGAGTTSAQTTTQTTTQTSAQTTTQTTTQITTQTATTTTTTATATGVLPSTFQWSSSAALIGPKSDSEMLAAIKDPSIIYYDGLYHVFASTAKESGYNLVYMNFADFNSANSSTFHYLDATPIGTGYRAAPQVFFHAPQNLWYLIYQDGNAAYSTNTNLTNPAGWSAPNHFWSAMPSIVSQNIGSGYWVDMWVICDTANCYHFSSDDNGHLYRAQTSLANFPNAMGQPVIAKSDTPDNLFEASNVYYVNNEYFLIVECIGSDGRRYFRSWTSSSLAGTWNNLAASQSDPFAGAVDVTFSGTPWTKDISHGEMIRTNVDQTMTISPCDLRYLYQGVDPNATEDYNSLPWRLGLLTQTNSAC